MTNCILEKSNQADRARTLIHDSIRGRSLARRAPDGFEELEQTMRPQVQADFDTMSKAERQTWLVEQKREWECFLVRGGMGPE